MKVLDNPMLAVSTNHGADGFYHSLTVLFKMKILDNPMLAVSATHGAQLNAIKHKLDHSWTITSHTTTIAP